MAVDLLGRTKDFWTSEAIQRLSVMLDEQPDRVEQGLSLGASTVLAGLLHGSTGTTDARRLADVVKHEPDEAARFGGLSGLLDRLNGLGDGVGLDPTAAHGRGILHSIFGNKLDAVVEMLANDSGAQPSSIEALLCLLAPTLTGMIREEFRGRELTGDRLHSFLTSQRDAIAATAPGQLAGLMGVRSLADLGSASSPAPASTPTTTPVHHDAPAAPQPTASGWIFPAALIVLAAAAVGYYFFPAAKPPGLVEEQARSKSPAPAPAATPPALADVERDDVTSPATTGDGRPIVATSTTRISMPLPGDATVTVPQGSYLESIVKFLRGEESKTSRTFSAEGLVFDAGSKLTDEAMHSAGDLATIARAYPRSKIKIEVREAPGGPNDRDERKATARDRANAVRDVLVQAGVPADRVVSEVRAIDSLDAVDPLGLDGSAPRVGVDVTIVPE